MHELHFSVLCVPLFQKDLVTVDVVQYVTDESFKNRCASLAGASKSWYQKITHHFLLLLILIPLESYLKQCKILII